MWAREHKRSRECKNLWRCRDAVNAPEISRYFRFCLFVLCFCKGKLHPDFKSWNCFLSVFEQLIIEFFFGFILQRNYIEQVIELFQKKIVRLKCQNKEFDDVFRVGVRKRTESIGFERFLIPKIWNRGISVQFLVLGVDPSTRPLELDKIFF